MSQFKYNNGPIATYLAVCEDIKDPKKMGRVRVRVMGIHTELKAWADLKKLPVKHLPWAMPCYPVNGLGSIDELCDFQVPKQGSILLVTFLDKRYQKPVYLGSMPRIPLEKPGWSKGFSDPDRVHPDTWHLGESPIPRLARNEKINLTIIPIKKSRIKTAVDCNGATWDEPPTEYATEYTKSRVIQTEKHIIEIDDTPGAERVHIWHGAETCDEYFPDGSKVKWINGNKYKITIKDDNLLVEGDKNSHVDGNLNIHVVGDVNLLADGDVTVDATNITANATMAAKVTAMTIEAEAQMSITAKAMSATVQAQNISLIGNVTVQGN